MRFIFIRDEGDFTAQWPQLLELFKRLPWTPESEYRPEQLADLWRAGHAQLAYIVSGDGHTVMALALEHIRYPAYTAVNILAMAGQRPGPAVWKFGLAAIREYAQLTGATVLQALCGDGIAKLLGRHGFRKAYNQVRIEV
ncbi:hypothetical protein CUR95_23995 [Bordetella bronchiseptica]|nr:hypothetical protein [Bordetella bronchiseptica]